MGQYGRLLSPPGVPKPLGMYSHVGLARSGQVAYLAGQLSVNEDGKLVGEGDFEAQVRQAFSNLKRLLDSLHSTFDDVLNFSTYVARPEDVQEFMRIRAGLFPKLFSGNRYPPNTLMVVRQLFDPRYLFEVEAVAAVDGSLEWLAEVDR